MLNFINSEIRIYKTFFIFLTYTVGVSVIYYHCILSPYHVLLSSSVNDLW